MNIPEIKLSGGNKIPQVGLGTWGITDTGAFAMAFQAAVDLGYRHFDTAQTYENEALLGRVLQESDLLRNDFFITTKIDLQNIKTGKVATSFMRSLKNLQTNYVDLLLLHFPAEPDKRQTAWKVLEQIQDEGKAKSIGVSNYTTAHLEQMKTYAKIMPAVNQVELHLFLQQPELLDYCRASNIVVEAYSPLAHAKALHEPLLGEIAKKYGKSPAQIMLRWCIQQGLVVLPKSVTPARIEENIDIFDFEISGDDMVKLKTLESNLRTCWDPTSVQ